ncbi:hypothetical protein ACKKBF_B31840 [Auxenochlorella protothecoides x Auxenochlorella symbiontica]
MASDKELDTPDDTGNTEDLAPSDILDGWDELSRPPSVRSMPASLASRSAGPASRSDSLGSSPSATSSPSKASRAEGATMAPPRLGQAEASHPIPNIQEGDGGLESRNPRVPPPQRPAARAPASRSQRGRGRLGIMRAGILEARQPEGALAGEPTAMQSRPQDPAPAGNTASSVSVRTEARPMRPPGAAEAGLAGKEGPARQRPTPRPTAAPRKSQTDVKPSPASCSAPAGDPSAGKGPAGQVAGDDGAAAAEESRPPAAGGWGGWGALTKLKASVQQVAATAVDDVTQLTTSFQQVLQEIAAEEDDLPPAPGGQDPVSSLRPCQGRSMAPKAREVDDDDPASAALSPGRLAKREAVLSRLEGAPPPLAARLQAVDQGVERVAQGAGAALSSLWGWGAGLARHVEQAVDGEAAGADAGKGEPRQPPAAPSAAGLLGALRATAAQLVAEAVGPGGDSAEEGAGMRPRAGGAREALTLDQSLYVYGGSQAREELQELGAECSRLGHRACAAEQDPVRRAALEDALRTLAEALGSLDEGAGAGVGGAEAGGDAGARGSEELARDGAASTQPTESQWAPPPRSAALERGHAVVRDVAEEAVESAESLGSRADVLPAGTKHLAEVASLGMERTLSLARSVLHSARSARPSDDRISWPSEAPAVARILRGEAACALRELGSVEAALLAALDRLPGDGGGEVAHDDDAERRELMRLAEECRAAMAACLALSTPVVWWSCCASRAGPAAEPR